MSAPSVVRSRPRPGWIHRSIGSSVVMVIPGWSWPLQRRYIGVCLVSGTSRWTDRGGGGGGGGKGYLPELEDRLIDTVDEMLDGIPGLTDAQRAQVLEVAQQSLANLACDARIAAEAGRPPNDS